MNIVEIDRPGGKTINYYDGPKLLAQQTGEFVTVATQGGLQLRNTLVREPTGVRQLTQQEITSRLEHLCSR